MATVWIPSLLRSLTQGQDKLTIPGQTVGQLVDELERRFPGIKARLCEGDQFRPGMAAFVDTQMARLGLQQPVGENSEVHFVPAIGGGLFQGEPSGVSRRIMTLATLVRLLRIRGRTS